MAREKREIPFTEQGMRKFSNVNSAYGYFTKETKVTHAKKAIVQLFQETFELQIGAVSLSMAYFGSSIDELFKFLDKKKLFQSDASKKAVEKAYYEWVNKFNSKDTFSDVATEAKVKSDTNA